MLSTTNVLIEGGFSSVSRFRFNKNACSQMQVHLNKQLPSPINFQQISLQLATAWRQVSLSC